MFKKNINKIKLLFYQAVSLFAVLISITKIWNWKIIKKSIKWYYTQNINFNLIKSSFSDII